MGNPRMIRKIALATASRAERSLLQPVFEKLKEMQEVSCWWFKVPPGEGTLYRTQEIRRRLARRRPDAILVPCVTTDTLIMTDEGSAAIEEIRIGTRVLSHDGQYHEIKAISSREYHGDVIEIKPRMLPPVRLTPEHPILAIKMGTNPVGWLRYRNALTTRLLQAGWMYAGELRQGDLVCFPRVAEQTEDGAIIAMETIHPQHPNASPLPHSVNPTPETLYLMGLFVAEGSTHKRQIRFSFGATESYLADFVLKTVWKIFQIKGRAEFHPNRTNLLVISFNSADLSRLFRSWFGHRAENKRLPPFIYRLPRRLQLALLSGLFEGDGWEGRRKRVAQRFSTVSRRLAYEVSAILLSAGLEAGMSLVQNSKNAFGKRPRYELTINYPLGKRKHMEITHELVWTPIDQIGRVQYDGCVWNYSVEGAQSYVANLCTVHNCDRVEMVPVAMVAYYLKIPIFHLYAGVGYTGTYDDLNRRVISSYGYMLLAEDDRAASRLVNAGEERWRIKVVGSTHSDNLTIDERIAPLEPFDLVLVNGNPADQNDELRTLKTTMDLINPWKRTIWVEPSEKYEAGRIAIGARQGLPIGHRVQFMRTVERPLFLGLMRKCERFITNSSSAVYEAPLVGADRKVVNVGARNQERATESAKLPPAAEKVADLIAHYTLAPEKLIKPYGRRRPPRPTKDARRTFSQP